MSNTVSTPAARSLRGPLVAAAVLLALLFFGELVLPKDHHLSSIAGKHEEPHQVRLAAPSPEPQTMQPLTPEEAIALNATIPLRKHGLELASAFDSGDRFKDLRNYTQAVDCLTAAIYYEAGGESERGQRAIAQVVLNRVRHPSFPSSICAVVYQGSERLSGCQFTFTCDGSLARRPAPVGWDRARRIAENALAGAVEPSIGMATHYHAQWVVPFWAPRLEKIAQVGAHIFYRWPGYWGSKESFTQHYAGEAIGPDSNPSDGERLSIQSVDAPDAVQFSSPWPYSNTQNPDAEQRVAEDDHKRTLAADHASTSPVADAQEYRLLADSSGSLALSTGQPGAASRDMATSLDGCATSEHRSSCISASER